MRIPSDPAFLGGSGSGGEAIRLAIMQEMARDDSVFAYGEGINDPSGFFGTTVGLAERFPGRVLDTPNSEESLVGFGIGASLGGLRPILVNLRVEFLLLAMNQIVNHAAKWRSMTGTSELPLTIRALVGRGWGQGAQHSGVYGPLFAHVPGLEVAVAADARSAAGLLVACVRSDSPSIIIEPKAILADACGLETEVQPVGVGKAEVLEVGVDFTLIAVGDGVRTALEAAALLKSRSIAVEVIDLRWMAPVDEECIERSVCKTRRVGVVDIGWSKYGVAAEVARIVLSRGIDMESPLLDWSPSSHAPAGCFLEAGHYPIAGRIARDVALSVRGHRE